MHSLFFETCYLPTYIYFSLICLYHGLEIHIYIYFFFQQKIANSWFNCHKPILESNFSLVGDDGKKSIDEIETQLQKDSENLFTLWCSGRTCVEGMLVELKLLKRQDLVSVVSNLMKPAYDQVGNFE